MMDQEEGLKEGMINSILKEMEDILHMEDSKEIKAIILKLKFHNQNFGRDQCKSLVSTN